MNKTYRTIILSICTLVISYWVLFAIDVYTKPPVTPTDTERALAYAALRNKPIPPTPFYHDGCTAFPDRILGHDLYEICITHDIGNWLGETEAERTQVNRELKEQVAKTGPLGPALGFIMYYSVQYLGDNWVSHYRGTNWGYGWNQQKST